MKMKDLIKLLESNGGHLSAMVQIMMSMQKAQSVRVFQGTKR